MARVKTAATSPSAERLYIAKAEKFLGGAKALNAEKNWEAVACLAIHATISSCDAMTARFLSVRHKGEDHQRALDLMITLPMADKKTLKQIIRRIGNILTKKNNVEYSERPMRQDSAQIMLADAERVYTWAKENMG